MFMDAIVHSAVEEICSHGTKGLTLPNLWPKLRPSLAANGLELCDFVKAAVWTNLLQVPGLRFEVQGGVTYSLEEDSSALNSFENCEQLNLTIVAPERLRNNFVGIYDVEASNSSISDVQRRTLERLASARTNGITQTELSKEFGMKANNFFYVLKKLESRGLIVRQSTIVRTKEGGGNHRDREPNNSSCVMTNMIYLHRYAKHLGCQKRLEITKDDTSDVADESRKEDVNVIDFLPALKAVCDKLDQAEGKVLVVSDIKKDLNYIKEKGHKDWRILCSKLKEAQVVEEFLAKVKNKEVCCLRLLKKFSPLHFDAAKSCGSGGDDNPDGDLIMKMGKGKLTEQVMELTIEQQIYDLIDSAGSKGLTILDITTRLGLRNKQYYERLLQFFSRCGMPIRAESHNRGVAYRVWTSNNFNSVNSDIVLHNSVSLLDKNVKGLGEINESVDTLASKDNAIVVYGVGVELEASQGSTAGREPENMPVDVDNSSNRDSEPSGSRPSGLDVGTVSATPSDVTSIEVSPSAATPTSRRRRQRQSDIRYPCLTLPNALREQRVLKMLEEEKFMVKAEIHRRLEDLEKEKGTNLDKRTLERCLNKLQNEGRCKCIVFQVPTVTNIGSNRLFDMVLHPSTNGESTEVLSQKILERIRSFDILVRRNCYSQLKKGSQVPVLDDIQRIPSSLKMDNLGEARRANGYIPARMVQTKLFHIFLWKYLHERISSEDMESDLEKPHSTWRLFELNDTVKAMPFEFYLKIIGSPERSDNLIEKCRKGLRLSDLPLQEYRCLMDTRATGRLSWLINFLRRMQLIRFVSTENGDDKDKVHKTALTHALELRPYIEEPVSVVASSGLSLKDLRPHMRHDFVLSTIEAVEEYWGTLEYCYADTNSEAALHAFPGSAVPEVFRFKAWGSGRAISAAQRAELLKLVVVSDPRDKISFKECKEIASNLDLTLGQVLRVYHSKRHRLTTRLMGDSNAKGEDNMVLKRTQVTASRKRKRSNDRSSLNHAKSAREDLDDEMESPEEQDTSKDENNLEMHQNAIFSLKSGRSKKFAWTEAADRLLIIEYVKHRAVLGPNIHRTEWSSLQNVPAPRDYCRRRMASLNKCLLFRKALMRLCNLLADRYKKHLVMVREHASSDRSGELGFEKRWDDFNQNDLKIALGDVLSCKKLAKLDSPSKVGSDEAPDDTEDCLPEMDLAPSTCAKKSKLSARRSNSQYLPQHYSIALSKTTPYGSKVCESIAVSNAVELFKLILLSTSTSPEALSVLTETLRRYSQHDLFTAFSYLRERNAMVGGTGSKPYALSKLFLQSAYLSPFPVNTGKRASNFASWVEEREKELTEEGLELPADLLCGDIFNICALVSSGELSVIPCLPEEGVGEVDPKALKRDYESSETCDGDNSKKMKTLSAYECEISRREKGFPNIRLLLNRVKIPRLHALDTFKDKSFNQVPGEVDQDNPRNLLAGQSSSFGAGNIVETAIDIDKSPWDAMSSYAEHLISASFDGDMIRPFRPELFKSICLAIHNSGDQGLSLKEILKLLDSTEEKVAEIIVEVLETFGQTLKVPAYDSIKFVAPLYRSKYTLTPLPAKADENRGTRYMNNSERTIGDALSSVSKPSHEDGGISTMNEARKNNDVVHRVTILNHPKEVVGSSTETLVNPFGEPQSFSHILPWLNADGTTNELVYKGLTRRLLGIVMQNPGIMEDNIILKMNFVNPQSCRKLLKMMILDNHIIVRQRHQSVSAGPPSILSSHLKSHKEKSKLMYRDHLFANPMSTALL